MASSMRNVVALFTDMYEGSTVRLTCWGGTGAVGMGGALEGCGGAGTGEGAVGIPVISDAGGVCWI